MSINLQCPVCGEDVDSQEETRAYAGQQVGFCCAGCAEEWDDFSDPEKDEALDRAMHRLSP